MSQILWNGPRVELKFWNCNLPRVLASKKFLPAETLLDHGAHRAKYENKSFALRAARKMINIEPLNMIHIKLYCNFRQ